MGGTTGLIDWHAHMLSPDLQPPHGARGHWPGIRIGSDGSVEMTLGGSPYRRVDRRTVDPSVRVHDMEQCGVSRQILSPPPMAVAFDGPPKEHAALARQQNEFLLSVVAESPERFSLFGELPYGDADLVEEEIGRLEGQPGVVGVCLTARRDDHLVGGEHEGMWSRIAANSWLVFVHPADTMLEAGLPEAAIFGAGMPTATGMTAATLLTSGVVERVSGLRFLLSHGGGTLPALLARLDKSFRMGRIPALRRAPSVSAGEAFWVDSVVYGRELVAIAEHTLGPAAVVFGSDYPFAAAVDPKELAGILEDAAALRRLTTNGTLLLDSVARPTIHTT